MESEAEMSLEGFDGRPLVSVIIPTRDRPAYAARAVASALSQQDVRVEVVVIDDGGRVPLLDRWHIVDPRVHVRRNDTPRGVAAARNRGITESQGSWIAFLDDDDVWAPNKLRLQLDAASLADASWCIASAVIVDTRSVTESFNLCEPDAAAVLAGLCTRNAVPGGGSGVLVKRSMIEQVGHFDESLSMAADWEMWHRLAHSSDCAIVPDALIGYLRHNTSMTATFLDHQSEIMRFDVAAATYCTAMLQKRRLGYLEWIADQTAPYDRWKAARLKFLVAIRRRSPKTLLMAVRFLLVPSHVELRRLVLRRPSALAALSTPDWVLSQHSNPTIQYLSEATER